MYIEWTIVRSLVIRYEFRLSVRKTPTSHAVFTHLILRPENMYINYLIYSKGKGKGKAISLQAWTGPEDSRKLRLPDFKTIAHEGIKVVSPMHRPPLTPRKYSWYLFLLEAESIRVPYCTGRIIWMKNSNDTIGNQTRDLPACSAEPQPTAPPRALSFSSSEGNLCWFEAATSPSVSLSLLLLTHITERSKPYVVIVLQCQAANVAFLQRSQYCIAVIRQSSD